MDAPNFADMSAEELLSLIEEAGKALNQKIAAEKADLEERQLKLAKLEARRAGKDPKSAAKPAAGKPRGRPAAAPKSADVAAPAAAGAE
jgi:hypothetical protein